jgi:MT0933-like antitoxin protein
MEEKPSFADQVKALFDEYDVERRLTELADQADHLVRQGLAMAGEFAHEHRDDVGHWLDRAADAVNGRTEGRHADTVEGVRGALDKGVERIADQRPGDAPATDQDPDENADENADENGDEEH